MITYTPHGYAQLQTPQPQQVQFYNPYQQYYIPAPQLQAQLYPQQFLAQAQHQQAQRQSVIQAMMQQRAALAQRAEQERQLAAQRERDRPFLGPPVMERETSPATQQLRALPLEQREQYYGALAQSIDPAISNQINVIGSVNPYSEHEIADLQNAAHGIQTRLSPSQNTVASHPLQQNPTPNFLGGYE